MKKIVEFARENGAFFPEDLKYIGDNVQEGADIDYHELLFDMYGYIRTWSFRVDKHTGEIIPYDDGFKFSLSGFDPDKMRKKLAMVDWVLRASGRKENHDNETL